METLPDEHPIHHGNGSAEVTDHGRHTFRGASPVNVSIPPVHRTLNGTQVGSC